MGISCGTVMHGTTILVNKSVLLEIIVVSIL